MTRSPRLRLGLGAALLAATWLAPALQAETRYVTDQTRITLRSGEGPRYQSLKVLPSGTPLEVLNAPRGGKLVRVRTAEGDVGFVAVAELQSEPAARDRLKALTARLAELEQSPDGLAARLARLQADAAELRERYETLEGQKHRLEQDYATLRHAAANVLDVTTDRDRLRTQVAELTRVRADLTIENQELKTQTTQRWFLIGAGVLLGGVLLGFILPQLRLPRRRSPWGSL